MVAINSTPHGCFAWTDLSSHGGRDAVRYYCELMGWESAGPDQDLGPPCTLFSLAGERVAGLTELPPALSEIPSAWNCYVSVADADALMTAVEAAGGRILERPCDVRDFGRIAHIQDPDGAALGLMQPGSHSGAGVVNAPDAGYWNELCTRDLAGSQAFYAALFGWRFEGDSSYLRISHAGRNNGGMLPLNAATGDCLRPMWLPWFTVADIEAATARVPELGGVLHDGPQNAGAVGRFIRCADPWGARCCLIQLNARQAGA